MRIVVYDPEGKTHCEYEDWIDAGRDVIATMDGEPSLRQARLDAYWCILQRCWAHNIDAEPIIRELIAYCHLEVKVL